MKCWLMFHRKDPKNVLAKRLGVKHGAIIAIFRDDGRTKEERFTPCDIDSFGIVNVELPDCPAQLDYDNPGFWENVALNKVALKHENAGHAMDVLGNLKPVPASHHRKRPELPEQAAIPEVP